MNKPGRLTVLMGLARCGKSTYAQEWMTYPWGIVTDIRIKPRVIVNADTIRLAHHGQRYLRSAEPFIHACTYLMVKSLYMQGFHVCVDETSTTIGSIRRWLEIDGESEFIYIDTPVEECERRAVDCGQNDLVENGVIRRMYKNLQDLVWYSRSNLEEYNKHPTVELILRSIEKIRKGVKNND